MDIPQNPRILAVKLSSLGDLFHALPPLACIRDRLGGTIDWVTQPEYVDVVRCFEGVRKVVAFPRRAFLAGLPRLVKELRSESYDLVLDFQGLFKSGLVTWLARGARKVGPSYYRECARLFYGEVAGRRDKERHAVDETMEMAAHVGLSGCEPKFPVKFPSRPRAEPRPRIALIPCSRWPTKNWPAEKFIETGRAVRQEARATLFLAGSPADREACGRIADGIGEGIINLCGHTTLVELGSLLAEMDLVVSVDSGPMHIAAALGVPVLAVFGATDPRRTGPYGPRHRVITVEGLDCRPCFSNACRRHDLACLASLDVRRVVDAALDMLRSR